MSDPTAPIGEAIAADRLAADLAERFAASRDERVQGVATFIVAADQLPDAVRHLRDDDSLACDVLLDITAVDYLSYPGWREARFAVVYLFKSTRYRHRIGLKVLLEEEEAEIASISDCYPIADWLERETWDQYGIRFLGHPNPKRLLNHRDFVGHALRKDYPVQKRQYLSSNDPMIDELVDRLEHRGFTILDRDEVIRSHETSEAEQEAGA